MKRLIIRQGERVIRHVLGDEPVTIGRDSACDLYFSDQRLSRRHCRLEATPEGVRFEDLGSRNGSFMDSKRIEVVNLTLRDTVRLGGLLLSYEDDTLSDIGEDATVMLGTSAPDEDETVMLTARPSEHTPRMLETSAPPDTNKTVMLPCQACRSSEAGITARITEDAYPRRERSEGGRGQPAPGGQRGPGRHLDPEAGRRTATPTPTSTVAFPGSG